MEKFDPIKMQELVSVTESEDGSGITLAFQNGRTLRISVEDGSRLVAEFTDV